MSTAESIAPLSLSEFEVVHYKSPEKKIDKCKLFSPQRIYMSLMFVHRHVRLTREWSG